MESFLADGKFPFYIMFMVTLILILYNLVAIFCCNQNGSGGGSGGAVDVIDKEARMIAIGDLIPAHEYRKGKDGNSAGEDEECAVCLGEFEEGEQLRTMPECLHSFHAACIDSWFLEHSSCPVCRTRQLSK